MDRIDILRPGGYGLGPGLFVLQGAGEEKTQAVAWNAKLSDVNETRFFFGSLFFLRNVRSSGGKCCLGAVLSQQHPRVVITSKWLCNSYH